jgi:hypothetical protein
MTGSLDRVLEEALAALIDAASSGVQCVPNLLGAQEAQAVCPRIVVWCESQESPEFQEAVGDGIYGVHPVLTIVFCIVEATGEDSSSEMAAMVEAVDGILDGDLPVTLTSSELTVYGAVDKFIAQEIGDGRLTRRREFLIWARLP